MSSRKPPGYWTKERCAEEALKYNERKKFQVNSKGAYLAALRNKWLVEICSHMTKLRSSIEYWTKEFVILEASKYNSKTQFKKGCISAYNASISNGWHKEICCDMTEGYYPKDYWTKERCHEEALKYTNRKEFKKSDAYYTSYKNGWVDEICSHFLSKKHEYQTKEYSPEKYWTKERCQEEALKYKNRTEFCKKSFSAYNIARLNGWNDEICSHMIRSRKPDGYWIKEHCHEEALKYKTRSQFESNSKGAYLSALRKGWLDQICSHMELCGSTHKRLVYKYVFSNNVIYIGLTYNLDVRHNQHLRRGTMFKYCQLTGSTIPNPLVISNGFLHIDAAVKLEYDSILFYKNNGYTVLNKAKAGSLGGSILKWTKEACQTEALKYDSKKEFREANNSAYNSAYKNGWLDEIISSFSIPSKKPYGYWTKERCHEEALKYMSKKEFCKKSGSAYTKAQEEKWIDEICSHIISNRKPSGYWSKERCAEEALKYTSVKELINDNGANVYNAICKNNWKKELCSHMKQYKNKLL